MQAALPAIPKEPDRIAPAGAAGSNSEPAGAETSFKQQLTSIDQNNYSACRLAESSEQTSGGLAEDTGIDMVSQQAAILPPAQMWLENGHEIYPVIPLTNIMSKKTATTDIIRQILPTGGQTNIIQENIHHQTEMIHRGTGGKTEIISEQSLSQLRNETIFTKQGNQPAALASSISELGNLEGYKQKSISSSLITASPIRDVNGNHINTNIPAISISNNDTINKNLQQQQGNEEKGKTNSGNIFQLEQNNLGKTSTQDSPLIFSMNRESIPGFMTGTSSLEATSSLRLPSGTEVPHRSIVDQVINRFTMNRSLEPGMVTLKMYPAELGALRIEIRVDQENIRAYITTHNPQVQEIIDRYMSRLRDALEEQGLNLEHIEVNVDDNSKNDEQLSREQFTRQLPDDRGTSHLSSSISLKEEQVEANSGQSTENNHRLSVVI